MKRATLVAKRRYEIEEIEIPHAGPGELRLKLMYNGICGSDLHIFLNEHPSLIDKFPIPLGHEFSGIIDEIGEGVEGFEIGALATVQPVMTCGKCKWCTDPEGTIALCPEERFYDGGTAEYYVANAENVVSFKKTKSLQDAAMTEPLAVAVHGAKLVPHGVKGKTVLVTGAGTIGLLTAQTAKYYGASKVFVTDIIEGRLKIVEQLGMIPINPLKDDIKSILKDSVGEEKIEVSFECAGNEKSLADCIEFTETRGCIILLAVFTKNPAVDMFRVEDREQRIFGAYQYNPSDFFEAAEMVDDGVLNLEIMRGREFDLEDVQQAFEWMLENPQECIKVMLKI